MRRTAGYTWTDYKTNTQITNKLKITPIVDKLLEYKRKWIKHVNRMSRNRLPRVMKQYSPAGGRNHGRPLKRLLDTWDRNGLTSGPTPWQICDDNELQAGILSSNHLYLYWVLWTPHNTVCSSSPILPSSLPSVFPEMSANCLFILSQCLLELAWKL